MAEKILNKNVIDRYNIIKKRFQEKHIPSFRKMIQECDNIPSIRETFTKHIDKMLNTIQLIDCALSGKTSKKDMDALDTLIKEEEIRQENEISVNADFLLVEQRMALEAKKNKKDNKRRQKEERRMQKEEDRAYSKSMCRGAFIIGGILGLIFGNKKK